MLLGVIADDFTSASDIANTKGIATDGGLATKLYLGVPQRTASERCEAGVVAHKSRSIPAREAVAQSLAALEWLRGQGCRQIVLKYCSTFDSTRALAKRTRMAMFCPPLITPKAMTASGI
jgi:uncharacterized protein YgbK (DUF1537 family)